MTQPAKEVVTDGNYYSVSELTALGLPGMPRSKKGWYDWVERKKWKYREVDGGGGRSGIRREYTPPPEVMALIKARQRGEAAPNPGAAIKKAVAMAATSGAPSHPAEVVESLLVVCLQACAKVHGEPFQAQDAALQLGYAADLYNLLVRMAAAMGGSMERIQRLELDGIAQQLELFLKMGQARKFPPPPDCMSVIW